MSTIRLKTNQHRLIDNLRHAFTPYSMLGELLQNARRARARNIHIVAGDSTLVVSDDGIGVADMQSLIYIAESGWDSDIQARENAFGMGMLSVLFFAEHLSVHSGRQAFGAATATIIQGDSVEVHAEEPREGTEVRLDGVRCPYPSQSFANWAGEQLKQLCEAFPVRVTFNGVEIDRPLANPDLPWRDTPVGRVLINLDRAPSEWRCFLQGLPIAPIPLLRNRQIVLLRDDMIARMPDRQHLLNEEEEHRRIQAAINEVFRQELAEAKVRLSGTEFVALYVRISAMVISRFGERDQSGRWCCAVNGL